MVLNYIWIAFFLIAFVIAAFRLLFMGDFDVFPAIMNSTFETAKTAFEISLGLTGVLSLWMGVMKIGERGGVIQFVARLLGPVFKRLFPEIPEGHPVVGNIFMNISANMLGLDNAATPLGLKAMEGLQELNPQKERASNAMIMFLVLNTSGLTLIPVSIMVYRAQQGAANPTDVFIPILLATFFSTLAGVIVTALFQRINLLNRTLLLTLGGASLAVAGIIWGFASLDAEMMNRSRSSPPLFLQDFAKRSTFTTPLSKGRKRVLKLPCASFPISWRCSWPLACFAPAARWMRSSTACLGQFNAAASTHSGWVRCPPP